METQKDKEYKEFWDKRYSEKVYSYGKQPNNFFQKWITKFNPGKIFLPADGEGRNGVYAATLGWEVISNDLSIEAQKKGLQLADENNVRIDYIIGDVEELDLPESSFDAIALIFAHFSSDKIQSIHQKLTTLLKLDGIVIFEAYSKKHFDYRAKNPKVGGPRDMNMLFSEDNLHRDFPNYDILLLEEVKTFLDEGKYHQGEGSVMRFIGKKNS
ncbi:class I SAM-dependent methyltransferase [Winogradskyella endarachnes]|uniref:Methyltransferase domain-containing protein n=1 Tax=Winogradskyella endarachnes TaxID=2681965 RepID=A0A6L6U9E3_9FLAO|nr:class I SAM-dependent methyltransferase [Winogradskyella endarachnes]MUU78649.1 methyltransferase domain-containing protein [Winogradskyella endarachnes]